MVAQTLLLVAVVVGQAGPAASPFTPPAQIAPPAWPPSGVVASPYPSGGSLPQPRAAPLGALPSQSGAYVPAPPSTGLLMVPDLYSQPAAGLPIVGLPQYSDAPGMAPGGTALARYYDPFSRQFAYGNAGVQPYKFGWTSYDDLTWMPTAAARGTTGSFQDLEWNSYFRYARPIDDWLVFSWTPTWDAGFWTGPKGVPLPPVVNLMSSDLQLASAYEGPWNFQIGFTPQVNSDLMRQLDSNAYMFDGRAVLFYQTSPNLRLALGFAYWDRVIDQFIPYGGVIWAPNDCWEFRLMFPKTRISRYCGTAAGGPVWVYGTAEYNAQAYQIDMQNAAGTKTRGEMRDYRVMLGVDTQRTYFSTFAECGVVFDRQFIFRDSSFNFNVSPGLIARLGVTF